MDEKVIYVSNDIKKLQGHHYLVSIDHLTEMPPDRQTWAYVGRFELLKDSLNRCLQLCDNLYHAAVTDLAPAVYYVDTGRQEQHLIGTFQNYLAGKQNHEELFRYFSEATLELRRRLR